MNKFAMLSFMVLAFILGFLIAWKTLGSRYVYNEQESVQCKELIDTKDRDIRLYRDVLNICLKVVRNNGNKKN